MPAKSEKQRRFMQAIAHGARPRKKGAPTQAEAKKFLKHTGHKSILMRGR